MSHDSAVVFDRQRVILAGTESNHLASLPAREAKRSSGSALTSVLKQSGAAPVMDRADQPSRMALHAVEVHVSLMDGGKYSKTHVQASASETIGDIGVAVMRQLGFGQLIPFEVRLVEDDSSSNPEPDLDMPPLELWRRFLDYNLDSLYILEVPLEDARDMKYGASGESFEVKQQPLDSSSESDGCTWRGGAATTRAVSKLSKLSSYRVPTDDNLSQVKIQKLPKMPRASSAIFPYPTGSSHSEEMREFCVITEDGAAALTSGRATLATIEDKLEIQAKAGKRVFELFTMIAKRGLLQSASPALLTLETLSGKRLDLTMEVGKIPASESVLVIVNEESKRTGGSKTSIRPPLDMFIFNEFTASMVTDYRCTVTLLKTMGTHQCVVSVDGDRVFHEAVKTTEDQQPSIDLGKHRTLLSGLLSMFNRSKHFTLPMEKAIISITNVDLHPHEQTKVTVIYQGTDPGEIEYVTETPKLCSELAAKLTFLMGHKRKARR